MSSQDTEFEFILKTNDGIRSGSHSGSESLESWQFTDFVNNLIKENKSLQIYGIDLSIDMNTDCNHLWRDNELCVISQHMLQNLDNYKYLQDIKIWCNPASVADETLESLRNFIKVTRNLKSVAINGPQTDIYDQQLVKTIILSKQNRLFHVDIDGIGLCYDIETNLDELPMFNESIEGKNELFDDCKTDEGRNLIPWLLYQKAYNLRRYYDEIQDLMKHETELTNDIINCVMNEYLKDDIKIYIDCSSLKCSWKPDNSWITFAKHLNDKSDGIQVKYQEKEYKLAIVF